MPMKHVNSKSKAISRGGRFCLCLFILQVLEVVETSFSLYCYINGQFARSIALLVHLLGDNAGDESESIGVET